jgi:hypothetical protein
LPPGDYPLLLDSGRFCPYKYRLVVKTEKAKRSSLFCLKVSQLAKVFEHVKPFQPSLIFAKNIRAYLSGAPVQSNLLALLANIRLGWADLPVTYAVAYLVLASVTKKKCFPPRVPGKPLQHGIYN